MKPSRLSPLPRLACRAAALAQNMKGPWSAALRRACPALRGGSADLRIDGAVPRRRAMSQWKNIGAVVGDLIGQAYPLFNQSSVSSMAAWSSFGWSSMGEDGGRSLLFVVDRRKT